MYEFHYDYIKPKYGERAQLMYMDTDSFVYSIETKDFYKDIADDINDWLTPLSIRSVINYVLKIVK